MKRKGIYGIFTIALCFFCVFGCKAKETNTEEEVMLYAGSGAWEMKYIWEKIEDKAQEQQNGQEEGIPLTGRSQPVRYIYDGLSPEEYLKRERSSVPVVLIANSSLGYKICLGTGQSYRMRRGDRLFLNKGSQVEIYTAGLKAEKKSFDGGHDICEVDRTYENGLFAKLEPGREQLFYQRTTQKGKLYITYF